MAKWKCTICGWVYHERDGVPEKKIKPGTKFADLPADFRCPKCGAVKKWFQIEK